MGAGLPEYPWWFGIDTEYAVLPMLQADLSVFRCPSSPIGPLRTHQGTPNPKVASANYTCCRGFFNYTGTTHLTKPNNGVLYGESTTRIQDVTDGTSNTFALGERTAFGASLQNDATWPSWCGPGGGGAMNTVSSAVSVVLNHPTNNAAFSSHHPGGAMFGLVDGSVRFIADSIDTSSLRSRSVAGSLTFTHGSAGAGVCVSCTEPAPVPNDGWRH